MTDKEIEIELLIEYAKNISGGKLTSAQAKKIVEKCNGDRTCIRNQVNLFNFPPSEPDDDYPQLPSMGM